jgi:CRP-like cAMP-binding protein
MVTTRSGNTLLAALDDQILQHLLPHLEPVALHQKQVLFEPGEHIRHVYFPDTATIALVTLMNNGDSIESGTVGREGATWISAIFGSPTMPCQTMIAVEGDAHRIDVEHLERAVNESRRVRDLFSHYSHALLIHSMRAGACNGLHTIHQRCARWMLTTLDRVEPIDRFAITQEFLAYLLGASRPTITQVMNDFSEQGAIRLNRGVITVTDRRRLESVTCECYDVIKEQFAHVGKMGTAASGAAAPDDRRGKRRTT